MGGSIGCEIWTASDGVQGNDFRLVIPLDAPPDAVRDDAPWCPDNIEFIRRINGLDSIDDVRRIVFDASYLVLGLGDVYLGAPVATPLDDPAKHDGVAPAQLTM